MPPSKRLRRAIDRALEREDDYGQDKEKMQERQKYPRRHMEDFFAPVFFDTFWTQADEDALQKDLAQDPIYRDLNTTPMPQDITQLTSTWSLFMRRCGCLPTDIVGPMRYLVPHNPQPDFVDGDSGRRYPHPCWPDEFAEMLTCLTIGSRFENNPQQLSAFILWAAACRVDDRRRIPWNPATVDGFDKLLRERLAKTDGSKSIIAIHQEVRHIMLEDQDTEPPEDSSEVMRHIEEQTLINQQGMDPMPHLAPVGPCFVDFQPLEVEAVDLLTVRRALNATYEDDEDIRMRYINIRAHMDNSYPREPEDFHELWRRVHVADLRWARRQAKMAQTIVNPSPQDGLQPFPQGWDD